MATIEEFRALCSASEPPPYLDQIELLTKEEYDTFYALGVRVVTDVCGKNDRKSYCSSGWDSELPVFGGYCTDGWQHVIYFMVK